MDILYENVLATALGSLGQESEPPCLRESLDALAQESEPPCLRSLLMLLPKKANLLA
jgi:hypothetical protein